MKKIVAVSSSLKIPTADEYINALEDYLSNNETEDFIFISCAAYQNRKKIEEFDKRLLPFIISQLHKFSQNTDQKKTVLKSWILCLTILRAGLNVSDKAVVTNSLTTLNNLIKKSCLGGQLLRLTSFPLELYRALGRPLDQKYKAKPNESALLILFPIQILIDEYRNYLFERQLAQTLALLSSGTGR